MHTAQSFFPTSGKQQLQRKRMKTFKVYKKLNESISTDKIKKTNHNNFINNDCNETNQLKKQYQIFRKSINIFQDVKKSKKSSIEQNNQRPIGGLQLLKKVQKNMQTQVQSSMKLSRKGSKWYIRDSRQKLSPQTSKKIVNKNNESKNVQSFLANFKEEILKQHNQYPNQKQLIKRSQIKTINNYKSQPVSPRNIDNIPSTANQNIGQQKQSGFILTRHNRKQSYEQFKSSQYLHSNSNIKSSYNKKHSQQWIQQQTQYYYDKLAVLNQIHFNKPLIQKLGNKYFECTLRDRYKDQPSFNSKSQYIYQIKNKINKTKFLNKIKNMNINVIQRNKLVITGKDKLKQQQNYQKQKKIQQKCKKIKWNENPNQIEEENLQE